jgi:hypothetical protein
VLARSFDELRDAVQAAIDAHDDPVAALVAAGRAYVGFAWDHPARYRLMFDASGYAPDAVATFRLGPPTARRWSKRSSAGSPG